MGDSCGSNNAHFPTMFGNGLHVYATYVVMTGAWCRRYCFTHMTMMKKSMKHPVFRGYPGTQFGKTHLDGDLVV